MSLHDGVTILEGVLIFVLVTVAFFTYRHLANEQKDLVERHREKKRREGRQD